MKTEERRKEDIDQVEVPLRKSNLDGMMGGRVPAKLVSAIEKVDLSVSDVIAWDRSKPPLDIFRSAGGFEVRIRLHIPISQPKRWISIGTLLGLTATLVAYIVRNYF